MKKRLAFSVFSFPLFAGSFDLKKLELELITQHSFELAANFKLPLTVTMSTKST